MKMILATMCATLALACAYTTTDLARKAYIPNQGWSIMVDTNGIAVVSFCPDGTRHPSDFVYLGQSDGEITVGWRLSDAKWAEGYE